MIIYGINPVLAALRAGRVESVRIAHDRGGRAQQVVRMAQAWGIPVRRVGSDELDRVAGGGVHQGVVAEVRSTREWSVQQIIAGAEGPPLLVVLDGVEDPHNVGAILRSVDAAGATGVIRQARHAAPLSPVVAKASAGALAHVKIATVVNIARALEALKAAGIWTIGLDAAASESCYEVDWRLPSAIVLGAEGGGLRRLVRERCDRLAAIPLGGHVGSLNVSVAAGIVLFEARRQRLKQGA